MEENIYTALAAFQAEIKPIELTKEVVVKTKSGGSYTFKYAPLPTIISTIQPLLAKNGLSFSQKVKDGEIITTIAHKSGQTIESPIPFPLPAGLGAQEVGSWVTYMRRYGLVTAFGLVAEEDDDANIASGNQFTAKEKYVPQTIKDDGQLHNDTSKFKPCKCGKNFVEKKGKYGVFYSCSDYPKCKESFKFADAYKYLKSDADVIANVMGGTVEDSAPPPEYQGQ